MEEPKTSDESWSIPLRREVARYEDHSIGFRTPSDDKLSSLRSDRRWFTALATHPVITVLAGIAHIVGLGRVASSLSAVSLTSLHSVDIDDFEEYDYAAITPNESSLDSPYGFYVAITPPHPPGSSDAHYNHDDSTSTTDFLAALRAIAS